eukprot:6446900-Pyramimonas_sp.AAC.1
MAGRRRNHSGCSSQPRGSRFLFRAPEPFGPDQVVRRARSPRLRLGSKLNLCFPRAGALLGRDPTRLGSWRISNVGQP